VLEAGLFLEVLAQVQLLGVKEVVPFPFLILAVHVEVEEVQLVPKSF
jgi:hypothetical protein